MIRRYVHLSTGNYNSVTAQLYTDIGMLTCDEEIGEDMHRPVQLPDRIFGQDLEYRKLLVAPVNLRTGLEDLIEREIEHQKMGRGGI
jgi:polyphosphate kinase